MPIGTVTLPIDVETTFTTLAGYVGAIGTAALPLILAAIGLVLCVAWLRKLGAKH